MIQSILQEGIADHTMKKSRFIGYAKHVEDQTEAEAYIQEVKDLHPQARHHVSAYSLNRGQVLKYDDDKEPSQTAGRPILDFIVNRGLDDLCIVVVRYFGGILLGKGGLVKAYTLGAQLAVEVGKIVSYKEVFYLELSFDYSAQGALEYQLKEKKIQIIGRDYGEKVAFRLIIDQDRLEEIKNLLAEETSGQGDLEILREDLLAQVKEEFIEKKKEKKG